MAYRSGDRRQRRVMARPLGEPAWVPPSRRRKWPDVRRWIGPLALLTIAGSAFVLLGGLPSAAQQPPPRTSPSAVAHPSADATAQPTTLPTSSAGPGSTPAASAPAAASPGPSSDPRPASPASPVTRPGDPTPEPAPSRPPGAAPASADEFDVEGQVIEIGFPFTENVRYRYRDNWLHRRAGPPEHYNHVLGRRQGELVRAHDGIDLYIDAGTPARATFAGLVVEPADIWQPWQADRYGVTVVILSQEAGSAGYVALLSHLQESFVQPGDIVRRGEAIGLAGDSGNAEGGPAHLHFELRAPFLLEWTEAGETRHVDAFNPYPSLRAADPRPTD